MLGKFGQQAQSARTRFWPVFVIPAYALHSVGLLRFDCIVFAVDAIAVSAAIVHCTEVTWLNSTMFGCVSAMTIDPQRLINRAGTASMTSDLFISAVALASVAPRISAAGAGNTN